MLFPLRVFSPMREGATGAKYKGRGCNIYFILFV